VIRKGRLLVSQTKSNSDQSHTPSLSPEESAQARRWAWRFGLLALLLLPSIIVQM
jgi:hypothetical protein